MLASMRNAAQGVVGKAVMTVVMGLIIVSFVIWGVGDMLRGFTATTVAVGRRRENHRPGIPLRLSENPGAISAPDPRSR